MNRLILVVLLVLGPALTLLALLGGCAKSERPSNTSRVLTNTEIQQVVPGAIAGDSAYSEVESEWLGGYYDTFRAELFRLGVTKWDSRFDCNHFATYYAALAQAKFYAANFHGGTKAQSLAVGTLWYHSARGPHAIVVAVTNRGVRYIEPQTGRELQLTGAERNSAFLVVF